MTMPTQAPAAPAAQRTYSNIEVSLDGTLISVPLAAVPQGRTGKSKDGQFKLGCPECSSPVEEFFTCEHRHADGDSVPGFKRGSLIRLHETGDDTVVTATAEEAAAVRTGEMPKDQLILAVHPAGQVLTVTRPGEKGYRLRPGKDAKPGHRKVYAALLAAVADLGYVWIGRLRMRDSVALYRLDTWQGQLILTEIVHPDDLAPVDAVDAAASDAEMAMAVQLAEALVTDFDPAVYRHDVAAKVNEFVAARAADPDAAIAAPKAADPATVDLTSLLAASIKAKPAKKPAKKTPARKKAA